jgi:cell division protein ZapE
VTKLLVRPPIPRGVYMWGGVGRGKSFLMDCFFQAVPLTRKTRLHFHEFMREVHRELQELKGTVNPLEELGGASRALPADLLRRVPRRRRDRRDDPAPAAGGAVRQPRQHRHDLNFHPDGLYPNGLHRDRILPAIELLKAKLESSTSTPAPTTGSAPWSRWSCTTARWGEGRRRDARAAFDRLAEARDEDPVLHIEHRELKACGAPAAWCGSTSSTLCGGPRSQNDYLETGLALPHRAAVGRAADAAALASEARRFTWLVDVLYDRRVKLVVSAAVPPSSSTPRGRWRTSSRAPCRGCTRCSRPSSWRWRGASLR